MHPLVYGGEGTADSDKNYWPRLGIKDTEGNDIMGQPMFAPIKESLAFKFPNRTVYFHGNTLMPECFFHSNSPGHWIFPFSAIFELGRKSPAIFPQFDRLALFKCACWRNFLREWEWGQVTLEAALSPLVEKGFFRTFNSSSNATWSAISDKDNPYPLPHIFSSVRDPSLHTEPFLLCFESLHLIARWGVTSNSTSDVHAFRDSVLKVKMRRNPKTKKIL